MLLRAISLASIVVATGSAQADITQFSAILSGDNEVPANASPATGTFFGTYDSDANTLNISWDITGNLIGQPSAPGAHLHMAPAGENGPVIFGFNNPDGTWPLSGNAVWSGLSSDHVAALFSGNVYANFHTTAFPGGEIRGQLGVVPSPGTAAALASVGMGLAARRRRR